MAVPSGTVTAGTRAATVATYTFTGTGWASFGLALSQGQATGGVKVGALTTQTDVLRTWSDGSIRHALVTVPMVSTGSYVITADSHTAGTFTPTWPTASVAVTIAGVTRTATLPSFDGSDSLASGPHLHEAKVSTAFAGATGTLAYARVLWYVRSYSDGTHQIAARIVNGDVTNAGAGAVRGITSLVLTVNGSAVYTWASTTGSNTLSASGGYDCSSTAHGLAKGEMIQLTSGPQAGEVGIVYSVTNANAFVLYPYGESNLLHFSAAQTNQTWQSVLNLMWGATFVLRADVGGFAEATYQPDLTPFYASGALVECLSGQPNSSYTITGKLWDLPCVGDNNWPVAGDTGSTDIGIYPASQISWQEHQTANQFQHMLLTSDRVQAFGTNYHKSDGTIINLTSTPGYWIHAEMGALGPANGAVGLFSYEYDHAHHHSYHYVPYIVTGKREIFDAMKATESWAVAMMMPGTFDPTFATPASQLRGGASADGFLGTFWGGCRGWGWNLRAVSDLASCIPDADADKTYFVNLITTNVSWAATYCTARLAASGNFAGVLASSLDGYVPVDAGSGFHDNVAEFELCYLAFGLHRCISHGWTGAIPVLEALGKFEVRKIAAEPDYPRAMGVPFHLATGHGGSYYSTWAQIWAGTQDDSSNGWDGSGGIYRAQQYYLCKVAEHAGFAGSTAAAAYVAGQWSITPGAFSVKTFGW
jgi:hypothetical protein